MRNGLSNILFSMCILVLSLSAVSLPQDAGPITQVPSLEPAAMLKMQDVPVPVFVCPEDLMPFRALISGRIIKV